MRFATTFALAVLMSAPACKSDSDDSEGGGDGDADTDTDTDSDTDADADTDTDTDSDADTDVGKNTDCDHDGDNTSVGTAKRINDGDTLTGILCGGAGAQDFFVFNASMSNFTATLESDAKGNLDLYYLWKDGSIDLSSSTGPTSSEVIDLDISGAEGWDYLLRVDLEEGDEIPYTLSLTLY